MGRGEGNRPELQTGTAVLYGETGPRGQEPPERDPREGAFKWLEDQGLEEIQLFYNGSYGEGDAFIGHALDQDKAKVSVKQTDVQPLLDAIIHTLDEQRPSWDNSDDGTGGSVTIQLDAKEVTFKHFENYLDTQSSTNSIEMSDELKQLLESVKGVNVRMSYDGYGDSGDISDFSVTDADDNDIADKLDNTITERIQEHLFYLVPGGWKINEGSSGVVSADLQKEQVSLEHEERVINEREDFFSVENIDLADRRS